MEFARRGVMMVLASPSGAGKSSISRAIFKAAATGIWVKIATVFGFVSPRRSPARNDGKSRHR